MEHVNAYVDNLEQIFMDVEFSSCLMATIVNTMISSCSKQMNFDATFHFTTLPIFDFSVSSFSIVFVFSFSRRNSSVSFSSCVQPICCTAILVIFMFDDNERRCEGLDFNFRFVLI